MDGFKTFYNEKKGKYILFFGFYLIFFIFLAILIRSNNANKLPETDNGEQKDVITTYNISNLINNDYKYSIHIIDNDETLDFNGTKSNIDYANYTYKYFLDIYNINQLLKKSKLIKSEDYILTYELANKEINELLLTNKDNGTNKIDVYVDNNGSVKKIDFDLSNYLEKDIYQINISYIVGDNNEDSAS